MPTNKQLPFGLTTATLALGCGLSLAGCAGAGPSEAPPPPPPPTASTAAPTASAQAKAPAAGPKQFDAPTLAHAKRPAAPKELEDVAKMLASKNYQGVVTTLDSRKNDLAQKPVDVRVRAKAMEGFAHHMLKDSKSAERAYRKAMSYWQGADRKLEEQIGKKDEAAFNARLEAMNACFAEALFYQGELKRAKVAEKVIPAYDGPADPKKVKKHFQQLANAIRQRQSAIKRAITEYDKVDALKPPPPQWVTAGKARAAQMRSELAKAVLDHPAPAAWNKPPPAPAPAPSAAPAAKAPPAASAAASAAPSAGAVARPAPKAPPAPKAAPVDNKAKEAYELYKSSFDEVTGKLLDETKEAFTACTSAGGDDAFAMYCSSWESPNAATKPLPLPKPPKPAPAKPAPAKPAPAKPAPAPAKPAPAAKAPPAPPKPAPAKPAPAKPAPAKPAPAPAKPPTKPRPTPGGI